jgi:hypothetical protein
MAKRFTTKEIIIKNLMTGETIKAGTSQRFTKSVLFSIVASGDFSDFILLAYEAKYGKNANADFPIKYYTNRALALGEFAMISFGDVVA